MQDRSQQVPQAKSERGTGKLVGKQLYEYIHMSFVCTITVNNHHCYELPCSKTNEITWIKHAPVIIDAVVKCNNMTSPVLGAVTLNVE